MEDNENAREDASREDATQRQADKPQSGHSAEVLRIFHELEDFFGDEQATKLISALAKLPEKLIVSLWWGANQDREIYYKDIAEHSGLPISVIHKEISQVVESGTKKSGQHLMPLKCNVPRKTQTPKRARPKQPKQQTPAPERKPTEKKKETEDERRKRRKAEWKRKKREKMQESRHKYMEKKKLKRELKKKWWKMLSLMKNTEVKSQFWRAIPFRKCDKMAQNDPQKGGGGIPLGGSCEANSTPRPPSAKS